MASLKVLIIGFVWPEPSSTAAGKRMLELIHFFQNQNYSISFACTAKKTPLSFNLSSIDVLEVSIELNDSSFDTFLLETKPDIVLFDRFLIEEQFGWRVAENVPNALRILDTEDLHSLRNTREKSFKQNIPFSLDPWLNNDVTKREIASIYRCDISLIISSYEMQLLTQTLKIDPNLLYFLPFLLEEVLVNPVSYQDREGFICIGNGYHAPNKDAVIWLKKEIWPLIRKQLPNAKISIFGGHLPEQIQQMHNPKEGFLVKGWAADAIEVMHNARICLAPLRFGAGIKGKLITALQAETPSVTTKIGAEGITTNNLEWNGAIVETAQEIANAAVDMYNSEEKWNKAQENGKAILNVINNKDALEDKLCENINSILANLEIHRSTNFIGSMLQHSSMASTKFMSKWIEEKNKK